MHTLDAAGDVRVGGRDGLLGVEDGVQSLLGGLSHAAVDLVSAEGVRGALVLCREGRREVSHSQQNTEDGAQCTVCSILISHQSSDKQTDKRTITLYTTHEDTL